MGVFSFVARAWLAIAAVASMSACSSSTVTPACVPSAELCNAVDDDCDGTIDEPPCVLPVVCPAGRGDCNANAADGCEIDLQTSRADCGACGHACTGVSECTDGACEERVVDVTATWRESCALWASGRVDCWGMVPFRGPASPPFVAVPTPLPGLEDVVALSIETGHSCAVVADGRVRCWGSNGVGELGVGDVEQHDGIVDVLGLEDAIDVAVGLRSSCALRSTGEVACWGSNANGVLGDGTRDDRSTPVSVVGLEDAVAVTVSNFFAGFACALRATGAIVCWGDGSAGGLGSGSLSSSSVPVRVTGFGRAVSLDAHGASFACAVEGFGSVACWGANSGGVVGDFRRPFANPSPVPIAGVSDAVDVVTAPNAAYAITASGDVYSWGLNNEGTLGRAAPDLSMGADPVIGLHDVTRVAASFTHVCALRSRGDIVCWGADDVGQLGDGSPSLATSPTPVPGVVNVTRLATGPARTCVLHDGGAVACWGENSRRSVGDGGFGERPSPVEVAGVADAVELGVGRSQTCVVRSSGRVSCWGAGPFGDGLDPMRGSGRPVDALGIDDAVAVAVGSHPDSNFTCAVRRAGNVSCWGFPGGPTGASRIGDGTTETRASPVDVVGITDAIGVAAGTLHACALRATGAVDCWGFNRSGRLGDGTGTATTSPVHVVGIDDAIEIGAGDSFTCALRETGGVACWGLFAPDGSASLTPVAMDVVDAVHLSVGLWHACATLRSGGVRCWGDNSYGQTHDPPTGASLDPVDFSGITDAMNTSAGEYYTCVLRRDATVACWGSDGDGQLGIGDPGYRLTPASVVGL